MDFENQQIIDFDEQQQQHVLTDEIQVDEQHMMHQVHEMYDEQGNLIQHAEDDMHNMQYHDGVDEQGLEQVGGEILPNEGLEQEQQQLQEQQEEEEADPTLIPVCGFAISHHLRTKHGVEYANTHVEHARFVVTGMVSAISPPTLSTAGSITISDGTNETYLVLHPHTWQQFTPAVGSLISYTAPFETFQHRKGDPREEIKEIVPDVFYNPESHQRSLGYLDEHYQDASLRYRLLTEENYRQHNKDLRAANWIYTQIPATIRDMLSVTAAPAVQRVRSFAPPRNVAYFHKQFVQNFLFCTIAAVRALYPHKPGTCKSCTNPHCDLRVELMDLYCSETDTIVVVEDEHPIGRTQDLDKIASLHHFDVQSSKLSVCCPPLCDRENLRVGDIVEATVLTKAEKSVHYTAVHMKTLHVWSQGRFTGECSRYYVEGNVNHVLWIFRQEIINYRDNTGLLPADFDHNKSVSTCREEVHNYVTSIVIPETEAEITAFNQREQAKYNEDGTLKDQAAIEKEKAQQQGEEKEEEKKKDQTEEGQQNVDGENFIAKPIITTTATNLPIKDLVTSAFDDFQPRKYGYNAKPITNIITTRPPRDVDYHKSHFGKSFRHHREGGGRRREEPNRRHDHLPQQQRWGGGQNVLNRGVGRFDDRNYRRRDDRPPRDGERGRGHHEYRGRNGPHGNFNNNNNFDPRRGGDNNNNNNNNPQHHRYDNRRVGGRGGDNWDRNMVQNSPRHNNNNNLNRSDDQWAGDQQHHSRDEWHDNNNINDDDAVDHDNGSNANKHPRNITLRRNNNRYDQPPQQTNSGVIEIVSYSTQPPPANRYTDHQHRKRPNVIPQDYDDDVNSNMAGGPQQWNDQMPPQQQQQQQQSRVVNQRGWNGENGYDEFLDGPSVTHQNNNPGNAPFNNNNNRPYNNPQNNTGGNAYDRFSGNTAPNHPSGNNHDNNYNSQSAPNNNHGNSRNNNNNNNNTRSTRGGDFVNHRNNNFDQYETRNNKHNNNNNQYYEDAHQQYHHGGNAKRQRLNNTAPPYGGDRAYNNDNANDDHHLVQIGTDQQHDSYQYDNPQGNDNHHQTNNIQNARYPDHQPRNPSRFQRGGFRR